MSSAVNPPKTIAEENEEGNQEENGDYGSEGDSQNETRSGSENSDVEQENDENQEEEEDETLVQRQSSIQRRDESLGLRQSSIQRRDESLDQQDSDQEEEDHSFDNLEDEEEEFDEKGGEEEEEEEEEAPLPPVRNQRKPPTQRRPLNQKPDVGSRTAPRNMYLRGQPRQQRRRWVSPPQRPRHEARLRDYQDNYMGDPISLRMHLTQMDTLKEELSSVLQENLSKADYISELEQRLKTSEIENNQLTRINIITEKKLESYQKHLADTTKQCEELTAEVNAHKAEIDQLKKKLKEETASGTNLEKRIAQTTSEVEKTKTDLLKCKELSKEHENNYVKKIDEMLKDKNKLQKQNNEMHKVIKKHMQLISNLRRQVLHIEAATALRISEEQFIRAIEKRC